MHSRRKADSVKCVCVCEDRGNRKQYVSCPRQSSNQLPNVVAAKHREHFPCSRALQQQVATTINRGDASQLHARLETPQKACTHKLQHR